MSWRLMASSMSNPSKAKGTAWETALVRYLTDRTALPLRRVAQAGRLDTGDIHGIHDWIIQAKAWSRWGRADVERWVRDAAAQAAAAGERFGAVIVKAPNKPVGDSITILPTSVFAEMIRRLYSSPINGW